MKKLLLTIFLLPTMCFAQNNDDAVDLGLSVNWASHNLGAKSPTDVGYYLAWGENKEKNDYGFNTYLYMESPDSQSPISIGDDISTTQYDAAKKLWGGDWRMPTAEEIVELCEKCSWSWVMKSGVDGYEITGSNGNKIFLPTSGQKDGEKTNYVQEGKYWSSTLAKGLGRSAVSLTFDKEDTRTFGEYRIYGQPIRPVKDNKSYKPSMTTEQKFWHQDKYLEAVNAIESEDYSSARSSLLILATAGDAPAQCALAALYLYGADGSRDYTSALNLLVEAAKQDYERAEYMLGCFGSLAKSHEFSLFLGVDESSIDDTNFWKQMFLSDSFSSIESFKDAFNWFYLSDGSWGYRDIMYFSAVSFLNGQYGITDKRKGIKWLKKSAQLGYADAQRMLNEISESDK